MPKHYLIKGDCFKILPKLKKKFNVAIIDPPYNTANKNTKILSGRKDRSSDFGEWDYFDGDKDYLLFTENWIRSIGNTLQDNGNLLIFCKLEYVSDIRHIYEKIGFKHHGTVIWHKTNPAPQIRKRGFLSSCEAILWATKGFSENKIMYTFNFSKQNEMHNFIETPICMGRERSKHPTQKPLKVIKHLIQIFSKDGDWILDCFAGSGTVAEAADQLNRNSFNIEKDYEYFKIMQNRLKVIDKIKLNIIKNANHLKI